jgi:hypothetical protein
MSFKRNPFLMVVAVVAVAIFVWFVMGFSAVRTR